VDIAVVYLAYLPYGTELVERFAASYREHPAGVAHKLLVALKGKGPRPSMEAEAVVVPNDCLDLGTYLWVARNIPTRRYLFLNTSSILLADDWLEKLDSHLRAGVGIVGATGSHGGSVDQKKPWPNPHMRTTAFLIERDLMLDLDWHEPILTKDDAYAAENGPRSITTQILERGLEAVVVGRDGEGFPVARWPESDTFWCGGQVNLMIADNGTLSYPALNWRVQRRKSISAWHTWTPPVLS
jgi:hypothetical protein